MRLFWILFGIVSIVAAAVSQVYLAIFILDLPSALFPKTISTGFPPIDTSIDPVIWNLGLIAIFGLQHSIMARTWFKDFLARSTPSLMHRAFYVLGSAVALLWMILLWIPMPAVLFVIDNEIARFGMAVIRSLGITILISGLLGISPADLMGWTHLKAYIKKEEPPYIPFSIPFIYRFIRHPIYSGIIILLLGQSDWSVGYLLFSLAMILYILIGYRFEERALIREFGSEYRLYMKQVPALIPRPTKWMKSK